MKTPQKNAGPRTSAIDTSAIDASKVFEPMMLANLVRAIDFVKFAETKNDALLTFESAWILASATLAIQPVARATPQILWGLIFGTPCFILAAILAALSFLPRINLDALLGKAADGQPNLLFFGDLAKVAPKSVHDALIRRYATLGEPILNGVYFTDLGCQIGVNSGIARRKYHMFLWGVNAVLLGFGIYVFNAGALVVERLTSG